MINNKEWIDNYYEAIDLIKKGDLKIDKLPKKTKSGEKIYLDYLNWANVWNWAISKYPGLIFNIEEVNQFGVIGSITLNEKKASMILSMETYSSGAMQSAEAIAPRVLVKLIAQYLGFGFHLWLEPTNTENQQFNTNFKNIKVSKF